MEETHLDEGENVREGDVSPALIAVHPLNESVVVAVGSELRVFDLQGDCAVSLSNGSYGPSHTDAVRSMCFGANGKLFASGGDDKCIRIWNTESWCCLHTVCSEKRVSAVAISHDGRFVSFADKFGVVWLVGLDEDGESQTSINKKAVPILGHYCSIITSLKFSPDGRFIASADRDFKIRISVFPRRPFMGAHEIQSFCLGHTDFISCIAFICPSDFPPGFLLSGSGDSTVRLWDFVSGRLLDTCQVGTKAGIVGSTEGQEETCPAVTDLCATLDGSLIAVAIQSLHGVMLLTCDFGVSTLSVSKVVHVGETFVPTSLGFSASAEYLWMVMGAANMLSSDTSLSVARVKVVTGFKKPNMESDGHDLVALEDSRVPGGEKLLEKLQGTLDVMKEEETLAASAEAVKTAMRNLLIKRQYSVEKRELRKKFRNDRKVKQ